MKLRSRLTAGLLAAGILLSYPAGLPVSPDIMQVFAADTASGTCGENLTWTLDDAGTLTVSGTGKMTDWKAINTVPWYELLDSIQKVAIGDGVTSIGQGAFRNCKALTDVSIPDSVRSIGQAAFSDCSKLTDITIPDGITEISPWVFSMTALTEITIPESVTSIGEGAFSHIQKITAVIIPESVTSIDKSAFLNCNGLTDVTILNPECEIYDIEYTIDRKSAVIHGYAGSTAEAYAAKYSRKFEEIPVEKVASGTCGENLTWTLDDAGTLTISGTGAMAYWTDYKRQPWYDYQKSIKSVVIEDGVTSIGDYAFSMCESLTSVMIPDTVINIGNCVCYGCTGLTSVKIPVCVTDIGSSSFTNCTSLTDITVDQNNTFFCIDDGALLDKEKTTLYCYPTGKQATEYTIPDVNSGQRHAY